MKEIFKTTIFLLFYFLSNNLLAAIAIDPKEHAYHSFVDESFLNHAPYVGGNVYVPDLPPIPDGVYIDEVYLKIKFDPNIAVTKEQLSKLLLKAKYGSTYLPPIASGDVFTDVTSGSYSVNWIEALVDEGIAVGCDVAKFCPKEVVTEEVFQTMLNKTFP